MKRFSATPMVLVTLALGLLHRAIQLYVVAAAVTGQVTLNPKWLSMQYLPIDLLEKNFFGAMLYLQQTPPLPNVLVAILSQLSASPVYRTMGLIAFAGILSCVAGALLVVLLLRLRVWPPAAFVIALLFLGNSGVIVLEYAALGQCFYEQMTMVGCLIAAIAAVSLAQHNSIGAALWLGLAVAVLALTRATFSYFAIPVIAWLLWQRVPPKYLLAFLLPVTLLHGGWAAKQYWVQGHWLWATSSWGGANAQFGDIKRGTAESFNSWQAHANIDCAQRWPGDASSPLSIFFSYSTNYNSPDALRNAPANRGPSAGARAVDLAAFETRKMWLIPDSAGFRELSACVQRMYLGYWLSNPGNAIKGWAKSYAVFWQPMDNYTAILPTAVVAFRSSPIEDAKPSLLGTIANLLSAPQYFMRQEVMPWYISAGQPVLIPTNVYVIPFGPPLATALAFVMLHGLPFVAAYILIKRHSLKAVFPAGFSFLLLLYIYTAGLSNLVEYKENMRFRLPVEPIIWSIGIITASVIMNLVRQHWPQRSNFSHRSSTEQSI